MTISTRFTRSDGSRLTSVAPSREDGAARRPSKRTRVRWTPRFRRFRKLPAFGPVATTFPVVGRVDPRNAGSMFSDSAISPGFAFTSCSPEVTVTGVGACEPSAIAREPVTMMSAIASSSPDAGNASALPWSGGVVVDGVDDAVCASAMDDHEHNASVQMPAKSLLFIILLPSKPGFVPGLLKRRMTPPRNGVNHLSLRCRK